MAGGIENLARGVELLTGAPAVAFAGLPASPSRGMVFTVTDSNTVVWGATVAAGGVNVVLAWFNGTVWTVIGK